MKNCFFRAIALTLVFSFCLAFTACGKKKTKKYGGNATVGITEEPSVLDPHAAFGSASEAVLCNIFEGLFKYDKNFKLNPCLATEYTISEDASVYTFTIREGVYFHDGSELDSADVIYSLKRAAGLLDGQNGIALISALDGISDVSVNPEGQVVVTLEAPDSTLLPYFTVAIIPDGAWNISETMIGTGPFKFESYDIGQSIVLSKNDNYWISELPYLDSVTFTIYSDIDSGFSDLLNGNVDILPFITAEQASQLDTSKFAIANKSSSNIQMLALNNSAGALKDVRVRQAINYALNRDDIIASTTFGYGDPLTTGMSPVMGSSYDRSLNGTYARDLITAQALMDQAGYSDGFTMTITVPDNDPLGINTATVITEQLSMIGITVSVEQTDYDTWVSDVYTHHNYEATVLTLNGSRTPYETLSNYQSGNSCNFINYVNLDYDSILSQIQITSDETARNDLYHQLLRLLTDDAASCYIQDPYSLGAENRRLAGYYVYPMNIVDMSKIHLR